MEEAVYWEKRHGMIFADHFTDRQGGDVPWPGILSNVQGWGPKKGGTLRGFVGYWIMG